VIKVCEIFGPVIQGEGVEAGVITTFLRESDCNLKCSWCDTKYHINGKEMSLEEIADEVNKRGVKHITISGGEPVLWDEENCKLIKEYFSNFKTSLETNGTILTTAPYNTIVISPKRQAVNLEVLKQYAKKSNTYFKFVYENKNDLWWEDVIRKAKINKDKIYIMPEGKTRVEQITKMPEVMEYCIKKNFKFSPRLQVLAYDIRRGV
jgi:7-carboxy-7-deazaguanine synthase